MTAKQVESLRQKEGNEFIHRIIQTKPFIDDKWLVGISFSDLEKYLVVRYPKQQDKYLVTWNKDYQEKKVIWWDVKTHEELKIKITNYDTNKLSRTQKDTIKLQKAAELFKKIKPDYFHTDDFLEAQKKYQEWCKADGISVLELQAGRKSEDD